jgi:hypothetical protein
LFGCIDGGNIDRHGGDIVEMVVMVILLVTMVVVMVLYLWMKLFPLYQQVFLSVGGIC